jgi:hypothetical protein
VGVITGADDATRRAQGIGKFLERLRPPSKFESGIVAILDRGRDCPIGSHTDHPSSALAVAGDMAGELTNVLD